MKIRKKNPPKGGKKKRNNDIDILKAGGTRVTLFLLFKNTGFTYKSQIWQNQYYRVNLLQVKLLEASVEGSRGGRSAAFYSETK